MLLTASVLSLAALASPGHTFHSQDHASPVAAQERGWIGVALEVREDVAGDPRVVVGSIAAGSPAEQAGLQGGDVLLSADGAALGGAEQLSAALAATRPGQRLTLGVLRHFDTKLGQREGSDRAWLGVSIDDGRAIEMLGETGEAVRLSTVNDDSPAATAGLQPGDDVVTVDGAVARGADALIEAVAGRSPGDTMRLGVSRSIEVVLGSRPSPSADAQPSPPAADPRAERRTERRRERAQSRPAAPAQPRGYLGVYLADGDAAVIADAVEGGPAANAGVVAGDVIVAVDGAAVASTDELVSALRKTAPGQPVEISVRRGDGEEHLTVTLGESSNAFGAPRERSELLFDQKNALDPELNERLHELFGEWQSSQNGFRERWSELADQARERGYAHLPGNLNLRMPRDARLFQLAPGSSWNADDERESLRDEISALREELGALREQIAELKDALGR